MHSCYVDSFYNNDIYSIIENQWNLSCACVLHNSKKFKADNSIKLDSTKIYRFDIRKCVDIDECLFTKCKNGNFFLKNIYIKKLI